MFRCAKCSSVPNIPVCQIFKCAKFLCVPNVQVCQQEQQLHKRRRSIKSPFTCFACLALPCLAWPDSLNWMKLWKEQQQWEEMKLFRGRKGKVEWSQKSKKLGKLIPQTWNEDTTFRKATGLVFEIILIPSFTEEIEEGEIGIQADTYWTHLLAAKFIRPRKIVQNLTHGYCLLNC